MVDVELLLSLQGPIATVGSVHDLGVISSESIQTSAFSLKNQAMSPSLVPIRIAFESYEIKCSIWVEI